MKKVIVLGALILAPLTLVGSGGLTQTCVDSTLDNGNCYPGHVLFTGSGYPALVQITVTSTTTSTVYDNFQYTTNNGAVNFTEVLYPADTYNINIVDGTTGSPLVYQNVTTGEGN